MKKNKTVNTHTDCYNNLFYITPPKFAQTGLSGILDV